MKQATPQKTAHPVGRKRGKRGQMPYDESDAVTTTIYESALRIHKNRINDVSTNVRHAARRMCILLVRGQRQ